MSKRIILSMLLSTCSLFSITCYKSMETEHDRDFFYSNCRIVGDFEFLYWKGSVNAADYALQSTTSTDGNCAIGNFATAQYDYDPGFRIGIRYYNSPKYWEASAQYTRLMTSGSGSVEEGVLFVKPTFVDELGALPVVKAESSIKLWYDLLDVMVARVFDPNPHLRFRVFGGITGAWISQNWDVDYTENNGDISSLRQKWAYNAIGYRTAATFDWFWFCNMYLTGKMSIALTAGKYINTAKQKSQNRPDPEQNFRDSRYEDYRLATHCQMYLGPSYQKMCKCYDFEIFAGYEFNVWSNLHEVFRCQDAGNYSNTIINSGLLGLHGLTLRLTLAY